jgi:dolichyl-phosphate beta-glucosyltransferase
MSRTYIRVISLLTGFHHSDSQCGFKCMKREAGHAIFSRCAIDGFAFDLEVLLLAEKAGFTVSELPVRIINHRQSESKVSPIKDTLRMLRDVRRMKKLHKNTKF